MTVRWCCMIHRPARVVSGALIARPSRTCGALHSTACRPHRQPHHYSERALLVERPCPCLEVVSVVALLAHYAHCLQVSACQASAISLRGLTTVSLQDLILHRGLRRKAIYTYTRGKLKRGVCMGVKTTLATSALPTSSLQPNMKGI